MQFKAQKKLLLSHLQPLAKVTPVRSTMPILSSILFDLREGELTIQSSDIEITMISKLDVEGIRDGSVAIPSTVLLSLLNEFEDGEIEFIISEDYEVTLITSRGKYSLMGRPGEEFPSIPKVTEINTISIANEVLYRMIKKTLLPAEKMNSNLRF